MMPDFFQQPENEKIEVLQRLRAYMAQGNRLMDLVDTSDDDYQVLFHRAQNLYISRKYEDSAMICCQLLLLNHREDKAWELLGLNTVNLGSYPIAKMAFSQAMHLNVRNSAYAFCLAQTIEMEEGIEKALPAYCKVLELCHHVSNSDHVKSSIINKLKEYDDARM